MAPGMAETTIPQKSRRSVSLPRRKRPAEKSRIQSFQKTNRTAASVPQCSATSKASPGSSQQKAQGMSNKCALEEMGRNSASPCTMPRMTACQMGIALFYVPSCQLARYFSCAGVNLSIFTPMALSLSRAISLSMSSGTG